MVKIKKIRGGYDSSLYGSPIYKAWQNMKTRCYNEKSTEFHRYGGRSIQVCEKWQLFKGFYEDMGKTYKVGLTLDRIDNDSNYELGNCRWATMLQQANNRSTNTFLVLDGVKKTFAEWCRESKQKPSTIRQRYYVYGWSFKEALFK